LPRSPVIGLPSNDGEQKAPHAQACDCGHEPASCRYLLSKGNCTIEPTRAEYGYDRTVFTFDDAGQIENGTIFVQLKATDAIWRHKRVNGFSFSISAKDLALWTEEPYPVYLILFDAKAEKAYWLYIQEYFARHGITSSPVTRKTLSVVIDPAHVFDSGTPGVWRAHKDEVLRQLTGLVKHA
jgi:hypothetical protein